MRRFAILAALTAASVVAACQTDGSTGTATSRSSTAPLPNDVLIEAPGSDVSPEYAAYSGTWSGRWDGSLDTQLAVEAVTPPTATVVYSWGRNRTVPEAGWQRRTGQFRGDELVVQLNPGVTVRYRMREDGRLRGEYTNTAGGWNSTATLQQVN